MCCQVAPPGARTIELGAGAAAAKNAVISAPSPRWPEKGSPRSIILVNTPAAQLPRTSAALLRQSEELCKTYLQGFNRIARPPASRNCHHTPRRSLAEQGVWFSATSLRSRVRPIGRRPAAQNRRPTRDAPRPRPAQTFIIKSRTTQAEGIALQIAPRGQKHRVAAGIELFFSPFSAASDVSLASTVD